MLASAVRETNKTEWALPIVLVRKKDGTLFFGLVNRKLKTVKIWGLYPIPSMNECMNSLGDATMFPTLLASCEYSQVKAAHDSRDKTAF